MRVLRSTSAAGGGSDEAASGAATDSYDALEALRIVAILASPAVPDSAQQVWERIGMTGLVTEQRLPQAATWGGYPGGRPVVKGEPLFPRLAVDK